MLVKPQMVSRLQNLNEHGSQCEPEDNEVTPHYSNADSMLSCFGCNPGQRVLNLSRKPFKSVNTFIPLIVPVYVPPKLEKCAIR